MNFAKLALLAAKVVAACGTECHASRLELITPDEPWASCLVKGPPSFDPSHGGKKKAKPGPQKKPRKTKKAEGEETGGEGEDDLDEQEDPKPKKKPRKAKKEEDEDDAGSSDLW